jgi:hypothetical protein
MDENPVEKLSRMLKESTPAAKDAIEEHIKYILDTAKTAVGAEEMKVECRLCGRNVAPLDRGVWLNDFAVCEKCAQKLWEMLRDAEGVGRTI